ncbi:MAG: sigma-70 family RNA polymerase sigma factor [Deltaproteobacteria bacterium]|nr:sigma-70 family RNA polymerase sigma factor [Deltaproteobacteria bacterium]
MSDKEYDDEYDNVSEPDPADTEDYEDDDDDDDDVKVASEEDEKETELVIEKNTVLTKEMEELIAAKMTDGKNSAVHAAVQLSCLDDTLDEILTRVTKDHDRIWRYLEDPREEGVGETSEDKALDEIKKLLYKSKNQKNVSGYDVYTDEPGELKRLTNRISENYQILETLKDDGDIKKANERIKYALRKRRKLLFEDLPYTVRIEFMDILSSKIREAQDDELVMTQSEFISKYACPKKLFKTLSMDFFRGEYDFHKAREDLIIANQRLVIYFARKYQEQGVDLVDLIGEGNIGLLRAVERFDPSKGSRLATYATWWIKHNLNRAVANQGSTIRVPGHVREEKNRILKVSAKIQSEKGREATMEELSEVLAIPVEKIHYIMRRTQGTISIDKPLGHEEEDETLQKLLPDAGMLTPEEEVTRKLDKKWIMELLGELLPRERRIIELRYGLTGKDSMTLQEVGVLMKITRERVRQLQTKAEGKLFKIAKKLGYFK